MKSWKLRNLVSLRRVGINFRHQENVLPSFFVLPSSIALLFQSNSCKLNISIWHRRNFCGPMVVVLVGFQCTCNSYNLSLVLHFHITHCRGIMTIYNLYIFLYSLTAKVNGHWGRWSDWTKCDAQCDDGKRRRTRMCDNPEPGHGGKYCPGNRDEEEVCTVNRCNLGKWRVQGEIREPLTSPRKNSIVLYMYVL